MFRKAFIAALVFFTVFLIIPGSAYARTFGVALECESSSCLLNNQCVASGGTYSGQVCCSGSTYWGDCCDSSNCDTGYSCTKNWCGSCGDGACNGAETCSTCSADCKKCDGDYCTYAGQCEGGYCLHNACSSSATWRSCARSTLRKLLERRVQDCGYLLLYLGHHMRRRLLRSQQVRIGRIRRQRRILRYVE